MTSHAYLPNPAYLFSLYGVTSKDKEAWLGDRTLVMPETYIYLLSCVFARLPILYGVTPSFKKGGIGIRPSTSKLAIVNNTLVIFNFNIYYLNISSMAIWLIL